MSRYTVNALDQSFYDWDRARTAKILATRRMIHNAYKDYEKNEHHGYYEPNESSFRYWAERKFGVVPNLHNGKVDGSYQIVDDKKHLLFLIKYGN